MHKHEYGTDYIAVEIKSNYGRRDRMSNEKTHETKYNK